MGLGADGAGVCSIYCSVLGSVTGLKGVPSLRFHRKSLEPRARVSHAVSHLSSRTIVIQEVATFRKHPLHMCPDTLIYTRTPPPPNAVPVQDEVMQTEVQLSFLSALHPAVPSLPLTMTGGTGRLSAWRPWALCFSLWTSHSLSQGPGS